MAQARCANGHIYDSELYGDRCPYCDRGTSTIYFDDRYSDGLEGFSQEGFGRSEARSSITPEAIGKTAPPKAFLEKQEEIRGTVGVFEKRHGNDPVVGWLVCVKGAPIGEDYRLRARTNLIGRGGEMDIRIKGDDTITSDTHAKIDYDILNNNFYLLPANNRNTIYRNGAPVYAAQQLEAYDRLRFGETELVFVPFCNDRFRWPEADGRGV